MELVNQVCVEFVDRRALFLRISAIVHANLLIGVVEFPSLTLVLVVEVHHEQWILEVNEEVAHVGHLLRLLLVFDDVKRGISSFMIAINLVFEFLLGVATWDIFHTQICT